MARDHARLQVNIWHDPEFRALTQDAQWAYFAILSQPGLSYVGIIDYLPTRLGSLTTDGTEARAKKAIKALEKARYVVLDEKAAELLIRTYVRHDGVLGRVNMGKATARAYGKVTSLHLRQVIIDELAKAYNADPEAAGWTGFGEIEPDAMSDVVDVASRM